MYCAYCGTKNEDGAKFCCACGSPLKSDDGRHDDHADEFSDYQESRKRSGGINKMPVIIAVVISVVAVAAVAAACLVFVMRRSSGADAKAASESVQEAELSESMENAGKTETSEESPAESEAESEDSKEKITAEEEEKDGFSGLTVGGTVEIGSYEQDGNTANGEEPIEWVVLTKEEGSALLVSKYILDCKAYNDDGGSVTWENCSLRAWLNDDFLSAFSADETEWICNFTITNPDNSTYGIDGGNDTTDRIFLLSIDDVQTYFDSEAERVADVTAYAAAQGAQTDSGYKADDGSTGGWYLLRSPGYNSSRPASVFYDGTIYMDVYGQAAKYRGVRPAMWVLDAESDAAESADESAAQAGTFTGLNESNRQPIYAALVLCAN